jgi:hypothetical protein
MEAVSRLAAYLDVQMLLRRGVKIHDEIVADEDLPVCADAAAELGGRFLIKYLRAHEESRYNTLAGVAFFDGPHWFTPASLAGKDLRVALNLPPADRPQRALLLQPELLPDVRGPRRIAGGIGVEYVVLNGFPAEAIVPPRWPMEHL